MFPENIYKVLCSGQMKFWQIDLVLYLMTPLMTGEKYDT